MTKATREQLDIPQCGPTNTRAYSVWGTAQEREFIRRMARGDELSLNRALPSAKLRGYLRGLKDRAVVGDPKDASYIDKADCQAYAHAWLTILESN